MAPQPEPESPSRSTHRAAVTADIMRIGRDHLAAHGAAALSLRAIARELGMASSAIYRYIDSRDELLTRLVIDAYTELAEYVEDECFSPDGFGDPPTPKESCMSLAHAIRRWAIAEPSRYALIYGSPVPGYHAPVDRTTESGTRVALQIVPLVIELGPPASHIKVPHRLSRDLHTIKTQIDFTGNDTTLAAALLLWSSIIGLVSSEVFEAYGSQTFSEPIQAFDLQLRLLIEGLWPS